MNTEIIGRATWPCLLTGKNIKEQLQNRGKERPPFRAPRYRESFGRLVVSRAYADWQEGGTRRSACALRSRNASGVRSYSQVSLTRSDRRHTPQEQRGHQAVADCIEVSHQFSDIHTFVLVSATRLCAPGQHLRTYASVSSHRVVVVNNARLSQVVDEFLYYDRDVAPRTCHGCGCPAGKCRDGSRVPHVVEILRDSRQPGADCFRGQARMISGCAALTRVNLALPSSSSSWKKPGARMLKIETHAWKTGPSCHAPRPGR